MLARIRRGSNGLSEYLITGKRSDSIFTREDKDKVISLYGNLDIFEKTENYLYNNKNYKYNYTHITLSFSENDMKKLKNISEYKYKNIMSDMVKDYIKHHTIGYDINSEVIAYAEAHYPKIKYNEKGDKRYLHIHIGIAHYNPLTDTQLRTTFAKNTYIDNVLQTYINKKYDFTIPREKSRSSRPAIEKTKIWLTRKRLKEELKHIKNHDELMVWFKVNNVQYREVKTRDNHYYKIVNFNGLDINLRGKDFEHLQKLTIDKNFRFPEVQNLVYLEKILSGYYEKRIAMIYKRRSKKSKIQIREIYNNKENRRSNLIAIVNKVDNENIIKYKTDISFNNVSIKNKRTKNPLEQQFKDNIESKEKEKSEQCIELKVLKETLNAKTVLQFVAKKYSVNTDDYEVVQDNKIKNKTNKQKPKNVIDFFQKEIGLTTKESINQCQSLYSKLKEENLIMPLSISICKGAKRNELMDWEVVEVNSYSQLTTLMKQNTYSASRFDVKRDVNNVKAFNNLLIFNVDNDPTDKQLSIKEAKILLESKGVSSMILPSKSNKIEKFTASGKSKGIVDRYRIVIPTKSAIKSDTDKDTYTEFMELTAKLLGLSGSVDTSALKDKAIYYYQSPLSAVPVVIKADRVIDVSNLENKAIEIVKKARATKETQRLKMKELRANLKQYRVVSMPTSNNLTYVDAEDLIDIPITSLISKFEGGKKYTEGSYTYIKTEATKYSITDEKLAHDFKNDTTHNSLTYLQMQFETNNLNVIARELKKATGVSYIKCNTEAVKSAITEALQTATNNNTFEESIKNYFSVQYVKLEKDTLQIAEQYIKLSTVGIEKCVLTDNFRSNREQSSYYSIFQFLNFLQLDSQEVYPDAR